VEQSRRHAFLVSLLRVPHLVLAINKMDLVDYDEGVFEALHREFTAFAAKLTVPDLTAIPISALRGDNVVTRSTTMPWYGGSSLLHHLETVHVASDRNLIDVRFPVQYVIRPQSSRWPDYRGYAGQVAGGIIKVGDEVMVLPSGLTTRVAAIDAGGTSLPEAHPPMSVTLRLEDDLDISRGDMICRPHNAPNVAQDIDAMVCWMATKPLEPGTMLQIKHTTRTARAMVRDVLYKLDVNTLHRDEESRRLGLNDVGRVQLRVTSPLFCDEYARNRSTGSFVLIDETTNATVAGGMVTRTA
jgi:bifunctional enzyme CysN/CysC